MELAINLGRSLERVCTEAVKNLRGYNDFDIKLRETYRELEDEKVRYFADILCMDPESIS